MNITKEKLLESIKEKEKEINELLIEAHKMGLEATITQEEQSIEGKGKGKGFRTDLLGYIAPKLVILLLPKKESLK
ncbi:MAG: hypothetical protein NT010_12010 [Proteobacteria bacterium]|nr:hypothetical protein [Pseudomonadota bacterium]